jgi:hypothetical protein
MSRSADKPASLAELLGKTAGSKMTAADLPKLLGEKMPELPRNRVGRFRLMNALKMRFGQGFKNIPGIKDVIEDFDKDVEVENIVKMNLEARHGKSN